MTQDINDIINTNSRYSAEEYLVQHQRQIQLQEEIRRNREHQDLHGVREGQGQQLMFLQQSFQTNTRTASTQQRQSNLQESFQMSFLDQSDQLDTDNNLTFDEESAESLPPNFSEEFSETDNLQDVGSPPTPDPTAKTKKPHKRAQSASATSSPKKRRKR